MYIVYVYAHNVHMHIMYVHIQCSNSMHTYNVRIVYAHNVRIVYY